MRNIHIGPPQNIWQVYLGKKQIDVVFYDATMTAEEVRRSLIKHEGFNSKIKVSK